MKTSVSINLSIPLYFWTAYCLHGGPHVITEGFWLVSGCVLTIMSLIKWSRS